LPDRTPVNKEAFLQLLVAQIKNQNPLNPADGAQFLSQLAQFSELEQMLGIRSEIAALREDLKPAEPETGETPNV
jgi:flagellar basal-body rod modification protein FlgD